MPDLFANLALGFATALTPMNLVLCFIGVLVGTLVGVLPGVGPIATIAMLMPLTLKADPVGALIMLAGIYYGAQYGGSTTAILCNMPGEVTAVVTALDGHMMAKQGAGTALGVAALASFFAGSVATLVIAAIGAPLTKLALLFGPAEYFGLMVFGLGLAIVLAHGSVLKAVIMVVLGLLLSTVGTDLETGEERITLGFSALSDRSLPIRWRRSSRRIRRGSAMARWKASQVPRLPTMRGPRRRSSRCSRWAFRRTPSWRSWSAR
jgi:putative tricarboxylic transport membrane protein